MEVGAGTFHPATTLRVAGRPGPGLRPMSSPRAARPTGAMAKTPTGCSTTTSTRCSSNPRRRTCRTLYLGSLDAIGIDTALHDIRFVEDDWESPTLGAWGLGWEVWCDGMEVSQFTYFQQVGGHDCHPVSGELTYGLERLAMYVLGVDHVMDMPFNDPQSPIPLDLRRYLPPDRGGIFAPQLRCRRTPRCCCAISRMPRPNASACWMQPADGSEHRQADHHGPSGL